MAVEYARRSVTTGATFLGARRCILMDGEDVGRLDEFTDEARPWAILWGPYPDDWDYYASFMTRDEAVAFVETHANAIKNGLDVEDR